MAQHFCTGPAHIFVAPNSATINPNLDYQSQYPSSGSLTISRVPVYLGTAEKQPRIVVDSQFEPLFNDLGGGTPLDYMFQGEEGVVSVVLTRWEEPVLRRIRSVANPGAVPGLNPNGDLGKFMGLEGATYPLYISFPYAAKAAMAGMPFGYRFFAAYLQGPFEVMPGTTALRKQLIFKCIRHWTGNHLLTTMTPGVPPVNARLYDHDMGGLPAIS